MANNEFDWGSIFAPQKDTSIPAPAEPEAPDYWGDSAVAFPKTPEVPETPQDSEQSYNWGDALATLPQRQPTPDVPEQAIPDEQHLLKGLWTLASQAPTTVVDVVPLTIGRAIRGGDEDLSDEGLLDRWINTNNAERERRRSLAPEEREQTWFKVPFTDIKVTLGDAENAADSIGYSVVNAVTAFYTKIAVASATTAATANPIAGAVAGNVAGLAAGTALSGRATKDQFVDDVQDMFIKAYNVKEITPELEAAWSEFYDDIEGDANMYGFWEAAPETVGNMLTLGIAKAGKGKLIGPALAGIKEKIAKKVTSDIGKAAAKVAATAGIGTVKFASMLTEEAITETITAKKQGEIEFKHGTRDEVPTWETAFTEVLPMVLITTPIMGGGITAASKLANRGNILKNANPDAIPDAPDQVKNKTDAKAILEIATNRAAEAELAIVEAGVQGMPVPGQPIAPVEQPIPVEPEPVQGAEIQLDNIDQIADAVAGIEIDEDVAVSEAPISVLDRVNTGEITAQEAVAIHEEEYLAKPEVRPVWGSKAKGVVDPKTDYQVAYNEQLKQEARRDLKQKMGQSVQEMSQPVTNYKKFIDNASKKQTGSSHSELYGEDFMRQVDTKELSPIQRVWKQVAQSLYGRDVFYVDYNQKVKDDPYSTLNIKKGARMVGSGAVIIVKGDDIRNTGTLFHEVTHDMNRTAPALWKSITTFINANIDSDAIKDEIEVLKQYYGNDKAALTDELAAGFVGDIMQKKEAQISLLNKLRLQDPTAFTKLIKYIRQALQKLSNFLKNSNENDARLLVDDVDAAIDFVTNILAKFQPIAAKGPAAKTSAEMLGATPADTPVFDIEAKKKQEVKYYSAMNKYLEQVLPGKGGAKQYTQLINKWQEKGSFKAEELEWSGLIEWLNDPETLKNLNVTKEWTKWNNHYRLLLEHNNLEGAEKTKEKIDKMEAPVPATVFTKKHIMDYLKENEVSVAEVHKVELKKHPDIDLPEAVEKRMHLIIKIQNAIEGQPMTLQRDEANSEYTGILIESNFEFVPFSDIHAAMVNLGASERYADTIVSDVNDLRELDATIKDVQEATDPQASLRQWEAKLKDYQDTLRIDHNMYIVTLENQIEYIGNYTTEKEVGFGKFDEEGHEVKALSKKMQEALDKIQELKEKDPLVPAQYGDNTNLNIGGGSGYSEMLLTLPMISPRFRHGHWKDTDNVVAMVRFDFRVVDGKKILLIQELQSDWHQQGRKRGYINQLQKAKKLALKKLDEFKKTVKDIPIESWTKEQDAEWNNLNNEIAYSIQQTEGRAAVPDAPFKKTWSDLAMRRMAKMATELGQDYLAWVPAEVIQDRYSLVDRIGEIMLIPTEYGGTEDYTLYAYTPDGSTVIDDKVGNKADVAHFVGDELADKLWKKKESIDGDWSQFTAEKDPETGRWEVIDPNGETGYDEYGRELSYGSREDAEGEIRNMRELEDDRDPQIALKGLELEVGGEWAVNLYDKKMVNRANDIFGKKAWGKPKVFKDDIPASNYPDIDFEVTVNGEAPSVAGSDIMNHQVRAADRMLVKYLIEMEGEDIETMRDEWNVEVPNTDHLLGVGDSAFANDHSQIRVAIKKWLDSAVKASERDQLDLEYKSVNQGVWLLPITQKMKEKIPGTDTPIFDIQEIDQGPITVTSDTGKKGYFDLDLEDGISGDDFNRHYREKKLGYGEPTPDWIESGRIIRNIWGTFKETDGSNSIALKAMSAAALGSDVRVSEKDHGAISIIESLGFRKVNKTSYRLDERIPKNADIIAGNYQASWYIDLETKRSTEKLYSQIAKQFGKQERKDVGKREALRDKEKLKKYINQSWSTYREAADSTEKGDFLPVKNVLLRPKGIASGKGRQLLIQISSDFKSEGSTNIGDSYYEALYNKREGYLRPSNDFWELPEWMNRMTHFLPESDIYVIRNLKEAKLFLNQAEYDNVFFSVLDITKKFVKEVADTYTGKIIAGGYLPDGSYYKGMDNVTWVGDMQEAADKLGVEFKNGVDYRYFKNTKTIPRLEMSKGCLHNCAFCSQDRFLTVSSPGDITAQINEYGEFDYEIVYLNDKTFGQAENYPDLVNIKAELKAANPNFKGFVIQTTATEYLKMDDEFLTSAGIVYLEIGVETFNDKMLGLLNKPHREKHILEAAAKARRLNQVFVPNVMVGLASKEKSGKIFVETEETYARTLEFLNSNKDIVSHLNIGVLAAESGTKLHQQLDAVESDQDEFHTERTWLKNVDIHEKFFADLSAFGEAQLDSKEVAAYVKNSMAINAGYGGVATIKEAASVQFKMLQGMMPDGVKLDSLGEEGSTTPLGMMQITITDEKSPATGGSFNIKIGNEKVIADEVQRSVDNYVEIRKGLQKDLRDRMTEDLEAPVVEGDRQSMSYRYAYYGIFDLAKKAKGMKNVRKYLQRIKELNDLPVTKELVKNIGNVADRLYKDKKKANAFKRVIAMREDLSTGKKLANDPKVIKEMEEIPNLQPYTIRYTAPNYAIGQRMRYGKFLASEALFDADREVTRETKLSFKNPITGNMESLKKQYDKEGNRLISGPIFSADRNTRLKEIKKVVLKNKKYASWYENWKKFMFQFISKDMSEMKIKRIAAISGILGAGKSPQTQQQIWAETINSLESGHRPTKVAKIEMEKMMEIWEGKKDDVLSRTDDEGIKLIQDEFGRKIGPYLAAAIDPSSPNVLVLDRHMPKGWGYNVLASASSPQGGWNMHPSVEAEVKRDIFEVADDMKMSVAGVQASLWFDFRTPAADQSDISRIAQIEPSRYVPSVFHKTTNPGVTTGIHFKKTAIPEGEFVRGASVKGDIKFNTYSQTDIGQRIAQGTTEWPYQQAVYMYQPGMMVEPQIKTGRRAYSFKYDPSTIYDGVNDPYNYWGTAQDELAKSPFASLTNIFLKLVKSREQYQGAIVRSPYNPKEDQWMMIFERAEVTDAPEITNVGISDMIDDIDTTYSDFESAVKDMAARGQKFGSFTKSIQNQKKYNELTFDRHYPSIARFEGVTSGEIELGLGLKLDGPLRSQRAYLAEVGISRNQRYIYLAHSPRNEMNYPSFTNFSDAKLFSFKAKKEYDGDIVKLAKGLEDAGLNDFNVVASPAGWSIIEQITFNDEGSAQMADIIEKFADKGHPHNDVKDIHSETLGGDTMEDALGNYSAAIIDYWGDKKGKEIIDAAIKEGEAFAEQIRSGAYQKRIDDGKRGGKRKDGGIQDDTDIPIEDIEAPAKGKNNITEDIDDDQLEAPVTVEDQLERIGRTKVGLVEKIKRAANYEKGTFTTASSDRLHPLKMAAGEQSKAYMTHRGLPGIQSSINAMMEHGTLELEDSGVLTTYTKKEGFIPWLRGLGKDSEKFFYWLIAKRDQSREKKDKKYNPMFTEEERNKLLSWTGNKSKSGKHWQEVNKEFQVFNDSILKVGIKSGLLDPAMVAQFKDQFYIPFYRIFEDAEATAEFIKAPVNTKKIIAAQIKRLRGTRRQMGDPLENIMTNWSHLLKQSMTNMSRKEAFEALKDVKNEMGELMVEEVPWKDTVIFKPGGKRRNDYGGADTVTFIYQKENIEVLGFKDNGKTRFFKVNDAELFNALSLQNQQRMPKWLSVILGAPKALLTFGATVTPGFVVANTLRDTLHTYTIAEGFIPFLSTAKGFYKTLIKDQDYVEYMASGNSFVGSYVKAENAEEFNKYTKKLIAKEGRGVLSRILSSPAQLWNMWRTITEASENAARLALYSSMKKRGATKLEASFAARDIMDFQKKGASAVVQYLTMTVPFLNARIQGLVKMGQAAAARPGMYALKGATVAMASIALWAAFKDDDRYKELEEWEKFAYYHFWIGDKHFRIPKPFETGVIWSSSFTAAADVMTGGEEADHIMTFIGSALLDTFAFNPTPQTVKPILEQYFNKNSFTGRPIEPESMRYKAPEDRYYPWDHESMIALGKVLKVSPRRAQALVRGYLAGLGTGIMSGADIMVRQFGDFPARPESTIDSYPMVGRFIRQTPARYTKYQTKFYDIFEQLSQLNQTIKIAVRDGRHVRAAELRRLNSKKLSAFGKGKAVKQKLSVIHKKTTNIWLDRNMGSKQKLERLTKLSVERTKIVKDFYDWYLSDK